MKQTNKQQLRKTNAQTFWKQTIGLPTATGFTFIPIEKIAYCRSDNSYTTFYFMDGTQIVICRSIKRCYENLKRVGFIRTHLSNLVNMRHVKEYRKEDNKLILTNGIG